VLLSDTVGFIRNLPHTLVTSFRATLEEVERAEVLLHVQDASSDLVEEQKLEVEKVLAELEVLEKPTISVLNKIDLLPDARRKNLDAVPKVIQVSGRTGEGIENLLIAIDAALQVDPLVERHFRIPQSEGAAIAALEGGAQVSGMRFEGNIAYFRAVGPASLLERYRRFRERDGA